jgi:Zn-dependent protease with chaperone function
MIANPWPTPPGVRGSLTIRPPDNCYDLVALTDVDLSFSRYVAARKGAASARAREGAQYAYGPDLRVRSALDKLKPVTLAVEATLRFWQAVGRNRLLGRAVRVSDKQFPRIQSLIRRCADALQIPEPTLYVSPELQKAPAQTLGSTDDATIVLRAALIDNLTDEELTFLLGYECGHIQNGHTVYLTALYFLTDAANMMVRWGAQPAVLALNGWSRRADITCDRAGLICCRDLEVATSTLVKLAIGSRKLYGDIDVDEYLRQLDESGRGYGRFHELWATHPYLPKRVQALRLFAETTYYRSVVGGPGGAEGSGLTREACDARVAELLAVLR